MDTRKERVEQLTGWLEAKGVELNERDTNYFMEVIKLAANDGYNECREVIERTIRKEEKL